jgi:hypothetical protein
VDAVAEEVSMQRRLLVLLTLVVLVAAATALAFAAGMLRGGRPDAGWNDGQKSCPHNVPCQME